MKYFAQTIIILFAFSFHACLPVGAQVSVGESVKFDDRLLWVTSGVWLEDRLVVVDVLRKEGEQILQLVLDEEPRFEPLEELAKQVKRPSQIHQTVDGIFIEDEMEKAIFRYSRRDFQQQERIITRRERFLDEEGVALTGIYDWQPWGAGILAFGDIKTVEDGQPDRWESGYVYFDEQGREQIFTRISLQSPTRNLYLLNMSYIGVIDENTAYVLIMDDIPKIGEVRRDTDGIRVLSKFPKKFKSCPQLERRSEWTGPERATHHYAALEESTMPGGLFGLDGRLLLLGREPLGTDRRVAWSLIEVRPEDGSAMGVAARLNTTHSHLTLVPRPDEGWVVIEKDAVENIGQTQAPYMRTASLRLQQISMR